MQRDQHRRGFTISHQKVVLEVDFSGSLWGYTEITVTPASKDLRTIHLHSRQCAVHSVTVATYPAEFVQHDPLANLNVSNPQDCHIHPELKRRVYSALAESDEGGLSIAIPKEVVIRRAGPASAGYNFREADTPEPQTPGPSFAHTAHGDEFAPLTVHIKYSLRNPVDGCQFVLPSDSYPYRVPHVYTSPTSPDAARCWVPCIDSPWEKCTWDFQFIVPRYLEEREADLDDLDGEQPGAYPTVVVCSGEFVEQVAHPFNSSRTIFLFSQAVTTSIQQIAWAAGPFHVLSIPAEGGPSDDTIGASQPLMHAFCLPGHENMLSTTVLFLRSAMSFYSSEFGSYPFGSHKLVFVDELPTQRFDSATLSLVTVDLLHSEDAIDQVFEARQSLSHALACQWVGINLQPKTWSDTWLVNGLGLYIAGLYFKKLFGNNEHRFRIKKDMQRVLEYDNGLMPPICQPSVQDPPDGATLPFVNLKSPLVLHILDRRLCKSGTSLGLSRILPKLFLAALSGDLPNNALSTHYFLRLCRKVSGLDPRSFADQWIYGSGCPAFGFSASFNRKKMAVEITMRQESPAYKLYENDEVKKALWKPVPFFEGQMTIRIHEADGTPYEHVLDIRNSFKRYEVPFNTKYKRVRRNTKRYLARQAAAQAAAEGDAEAAEALNMVDMSFGLDIWEKEHERLNWRVSDWTEEDEQTMAGATYEWIRIDADFEWIAAVAFQQPDFMWVSQLQRDRDVVAQLEAVHALSETPTLIVSSTLTKTALVSNYFFRIRCEAVLSLVNCAIPKLDFIGLFHLFKLFLRHCYEPEDPNQDLFVHTYVPRPNEFSDIPEYFVRKALINAISRVRFENGKTPSIIRQFLVDQLKYNDNTANPYSDAFYVCSIISSLACATVSLTPPERGQLLQTEAKQERTLEDNKLLEQAVAEIDRYRSMDRLIPSPHNVVTIAVVDFYVILGMADLIPNDLAKIFPMTREGNYTQVRMVAFDALFMTKWYTPQIMRYILAVIANDSSRIIRRHVARNACLSLSLLATMGEMKTSLKEAEALLIEEDGTNQEKAKEAKKTDMDILIKTLRKDREVGKNDILRQFLMPILVSPNLDHEVRWCLLKLADLVVRGSEETAPKVTVRLPPTPVAEVSPALPTPVPAIVAQRSVKAGTPVARSPLTSFTKLKLLASGAPGTPRERTPSVSLLDTARPLPPLKPSQPKKLVMAKPKNISKPVQKARSSGMTPNDLKACRNMLKKLQVHKHAALFLQPVDPVRDKAPKYFDIIKTPMDLSTIGAKLEAGMYKDRFGFEADFRTMINNCKQYNASGSYAFNEATALDSFFDKQWERIKKTLEAANQTQVAAQVVPRPTIPLASAAARNDAMPPPSASTSSSKPVIKLKMGGSSASVPDTPTPKPGARQKMRQVKVAVDMPPPPYVDDGSHDLLQEVIAIEREQDEKKASAKRKKSVSDETLQEDQLLEMSKPAKKERHISPPPAAPPTVPPKTDVNGPGISPSPAPSSSSTSRVTTKMRDKDSAGSRSSTPVRPKKPVAPPTAPFNSKKCKEVLRAMLRVPEALIFSRPVDPVNDGCPTYFDEISHPMDLGTIADRLNGTHYHTMEEVANDVDLVFRNCRQFNPPGTYPVNCADAVERVFRKEWSKASEKKLNYNEKRSLQGIMNKVVAEDISWVFREPVDPVALQIPHYFDVIPRKNARDLRTIRQKLDADKFSSIQAFESDIDLMVNNAVVFNGADSEVGRVALSVQQRFQDLLGSLKAQTSSLKKEAAPRPEKIEKAPEHTSDKMPIQDKKAVQVALNRLTAEDISFVFREPVDPVALDIPTYFDVVPRAEARDLRTIRQNVDGDKYGSLEAVETDVSLMVRNAIKFNGPDSEVGKIAVLVEQRAKELFGAARSKKRKDTDRIGQPSKRARIA